MKLFSLQIIYKSEDSSTLLQASHDLSTFGFFQRNSVREFMDFTGKLVAERTERCQRGLVKEQDYLCHVYVRHDNLCGVLISDEEYPQRVAQTLLTKATEDFSNEYPAHIWPSLKEGQASSKKIDQLLQECQDPTKTDGMMRLQTELDETKDILHNTMQSLLSRGEKLDDLVARSDFLSMQSKVFYQTAKKTNKCCTLL